MRALGEVFFALVSGLAVFIILFMALDWLGKVINPVAIYGAGFGIFIMLVLNERRGRRR